MRPRLLAVCGACAAPRYSISPLSADEESLADARRRRAESQAGDSDSYLLSENPQPPAQFIRGIDLVSQPATVEQPEEPVVPTSPFPRQPRASAAFWIWAHCPQSVRRRPASALRMSCMEPSRKSATRPTPTICSCVRLRRRACSSTPATRSATTSASAASAFRKFAATFTAHFWVPIRPRLRHAAVEIGFEPDPRRDHHQGTLHRSARAGIFVHRYRVD